MEIKIESLATIHEAAKKFIDNIGNNKVFAFYGKMGAGKTTASSEALRRGQTGALSFLGF